MTWQPVAVLYPDAELVATGLLREGLAAQGETDVWVGRKLPGSRPRRAVQIVRDGGSSSEMRDRARLRVLVWDSSDEAATNLALLVLALVMEWQGRGGVLRVVHESGPVEIPDAAPKRYLLIEVHFRGDAL